MTVTCDNGCGAHEDFVPIDSAEMIQKALISKGWQRIAVELTLCPMMPRKEMLEHFPALVDSSGFRAVEKLEFQLCPACGMSGMDQFKEVAKASLAAALKAHRPVVEERLGVEIKKMRGPRP